MPTGAGAMPGPAGPGGGGLGIQMPAVIPGVSPTAKADVELGLLSQKDPHPLKYAWGAEVKPVTDPGPNYYYFYYTGVVEPDARVLKENEVKRIPVPMSEWTNERKNIIAKLVYFYQIAYNVQPSALQNLSGATYSTETGAPQAGTTIPGTPGTATTGVNGVAQDATGFPAPGAATDPNAAPGAINDPNAFPAPADPNAAGAPGAATDPNAFPAPADPNAAGAAPAMPGTTMPMPGTAMPGTMPGTMPGMMPGAMPGAMPGMMPGAMPGMMPGMMPPSGFQFQGPNFGGGGQIDPRAVAEWTFYLDQFVLWQYYCSRNLLRDDKDSLIDQQAEQTGPKVLSASGQETLNKQFGPIQHGGAGGGVNSGSKTADVIANRPGASKGIGGFIDSQTGDFYGQRGAASGGPGGAPGGITPESMMALREIFDLNNMKQIGIDHHDRFVDAAKANEQKLYKAYLEMINRIDQRELNQEQYNQWIEAKRQQIFNFAENWRKLNEGEAQVIGDTMFLVTQEPLDAVPYDAVNIVTNEQVTPQDLINADGSIKKPIVR